jgi:hypothetical protein
MFAALTNPARAWHMSWGEGSPAAAGGRGQEAARARLADGRAAAACDQVAAESRTGANPKRILYLAEGGGSQKGA